MISHSELILNATLHILGEAIAKKFKADTGCRLAYFLMAIPDGTRVGEVVPVCTNMPEDIFDRNQEIFDRIRELYESEDVTEEPSPTREGVR